MKIKHALRLLYICAVLVPMLLLFYYAIHATSSFSADTYLTNLQMHANARAESMNRYFQWMSDRMLRIAQNAGVREIARGSDTDEDSVSSIKELLDAMIQQKDIAFAAITDKSGTVMYRTGEMSGTLTVPDEGIVYSDVVYVSDVLQSSGDGEYVILSSPIFTDYGQTLGYFLQGIALTQLSDLSQPEQGEWQGSFYLVDGAGEMVSPDETALNLESDEQLAQYVEKLSVNGQILRAEQRKLEGSSYLAAAAPVGDTQLSMIALVALDEVNSYYIKYLWLIALLIVTLAAIVYAVVRLVKGISDPLQELNGTLKALRSGDLNARFVSDSENEFWEIAQAFNTLMDEMVISEERHRTISELSDSMLFDYDYAKGEIYTTKNFKEKFAIDFSGSQFGPDGFDFSFFRPYVHPEDFLTFQSDMQQALKNGSKAENHYRVKNSNGDYIWVSLKATCVMSRTGVRQHFIVVLIDIDSEKKLELQLAERATIDFLSQVYNRSTFETTLLNELDSNKKAGKTLAIIFVDIDDFKSVNDRYNHACGDEVIKFVADCIKRRLRGKGFAGRFGGDEFVMCFKNVDSTAQVRRMVEELLAELENGFYSDAGSAYMHVKCSVGISLAPRDGTTLNEIFMAADEAMYYVKRNGKASYHFYGD